MIIVIFDVSMWHGDVYVLFSFVSFGEIGQIFKLTIEDCSNISSWWWLIKEWVSFFLGSRDMDWSAGQTKSREPQIGVKVQSRPDNNDKIYM